jgi:hypothetical protein
MGEAGGSSSVLAFFDVLASDEALLGDRATLFLAPTGVASKTGLLATSASSLSASLASAGVGDAFAKNDEIALMPVTGAAAFFGGIDNTLAESPIFFPSCFAPAKTALQLGKTFWT